MFARVGVSGTAVNHAEAPPTGSQDLQLSVTPASHRKSRPHVSGSRARLSITPRSRPQEVRLSAVSHPGLPQEVPPPATQFKKINTRVRATGHACTWGAASHVWSWVEVQGRPVRHAARPQEVPPPPGKKIKISKKNRTRVCRIPVTRVHGTAAHTCVRVGVPGWVVHHNHCPQEVLPPPCKKKLK